VEVRVPGELRTPVLKTPHFNPSTPPNSHLSQATRNPLRIRICVGVSSRLNLHLPIPNPRAEASLICTGVSPSSRPNPRISLSHESLWLICTCVTSGRLSSAHMKLSAAENRHRSFLRSDEGSAGLGLGVVAAKDGCARSAGRMENPACCALLYVVSVMLRLGLYVAKNMGTSKGLFYII